MDDFLRLNLIHLFTFYLTTMFIVGTVRRLRQYRDVVNMARGMPSRWPRVLGQIRKHWLMFLTWSTLRPALVALALIAVQMICSRLIWPRAQISVQDLALETWMLPIVGLTAGAMAAVDFYFVIYIGSFDRKETERYLDEAEHWLTSWKAPMVRVLTMGIINPRKIVGDEVLKAMEEGRGLLRRNLWWLSLQAFLRVLFGLTIWICWAIHPTTVKA
jgi:hypothetical protein